MPSPAAPSAAPCHRAVVIGASLAGLMAARVLVERFAEVVLLERDELPAHAAARKGTPHAVHPHGLLARGLHVIEALFPGFGDALVAQGALAGDIGTEVGVDANARRFARQAAGIRGIACSRLAIEAEIRRRVRQLPGVRFVTGADVLGPEHEAGQVVGVRWRSRATEATAGPAPVAQTLGASLVVDCSGRGSRAPAWLREWGYAPPAEERVAIGMAYASAYFRRPEAARPPLAVIIGAATPTLPRPSILIAQERGPEGCTRWVAGVGGYAGDHVAPTREAMAERARATGQHEIAELAERGELLGEVMRYTFPHSQRRRYERLRRFPAGFLVLGDALASFNPIYGQGMTVAACEALALRDALAGPPRTLARRFFRAAARIVDTPWQLAVGGDLALPMVQGARPLPLRLVNAYVGRLQRVAVQDPVVAAAFIQVMHMLAPPPSLFAPRIVWRVWRGGRASAAPAARTLSEAASPGAPRPASRTARARPR